MTVELQERIKSGESDIAERTSTHDSNPYSTLELISENKSAAWLPKIDPKFGPNIAELKPGLQIASSTLLVDTEKKSMGAAAGSSGVSNWLREHGTEIGGIVAASAFLLAAPSGRVFSRFATLFKPTMRDSLAPVMTRSEFASASTGSKLKGIDTFVFDFDRTLIDTDRAFFAYRGTLQQELSSTLNLDRKFVSSALESTERSLGSLFFARRLDLIEPLKNRFPGKDLNQLYPEIAGKTERAFQQALQPKSEVKNLLEELSALRATGKVKNVVMFTAGSPAHTAQKLEAAGLQKYFDRVFTGAKHPFEDSAHSGLAYSPSTQSNFIALKSLPKSDSEGYSEIVHRLGTSPSRTAMTGDHIQEDVLRAKQAGLKTFWATWYARSGKADVLPDLVLYSPNQLSTFIKASR